MFGLFVARLLINLHRCPIRNHFRIGPRRSTELTNAAVWLLLAVTASDARRQLASNAVDNLPCAASAISEL